MHLTTIQMPHNLVEICENECSHNIVVHWLLIVTDCYFANGNIEHSLCNLIFNQF